VIIKDANKQAIQKPADSTLREVITKAGVAESDLMKAAELIRDAEKIAFIYGKGLSQDALKQLIHLAEVTDAKVISTKGGANSLAASLLDLNSPVKLNGHQAVFVALGSEKPSQHTIQQLEKSPFLVVQATYSSALTARADVVLPSQSWLEQDGSFINFDGRTQRSVKSITGPEGTKSDHVIFEELALKFNLNPGNDWKKTLAEKVSPVALQG
jgi:predicted molibdopterin-dependent oxidoreductase YjgC